MTPDRRTAPGTGAVRSQFATTANDPASLATEVDLASLSAAQFSLWLAGFLCGCLHGNEDGYAAAQADMGAAHAHLAASIRKAASQPSHARLVEARRRHQVEAAERAYEAAVPWLEESA